MAQNTYSIRMDSNLKRQFDEICNELGLSSSTAFTMFAKSVVREQRIPLSLELPRKVSLQDGFSAGEEIRAQAKLAGVADMSMEEIDKEIALARAERKVV